MKNTETIKNLRSQKLTELTKVLDEEQEKLIRLNMELGAKKLKDYSKIKKGRRQVARVYTIINEKFRAENDQ